MTDFRLLVVRIFVTDWPPGSASSRWSASIRAPSPISAIRMVTSSRS